MDVPISHRRGFNRRTLLSAGALILLLGLMILFGAFSGSSTSMSIASSGVESYVISNKVFIETLSARGIVVPSRSVILDLEEGGKVIAVHQEEGDNVEVGDLIAELDNTALRLSITSREAEVSEQVNNLRNTRLDMEREKLELAIEVKRIEYAQQKLKKQIQRRKILVEKNMLPEEDLELLRDELEHSNTLLLLTRERQDSELEFRESQISLLEATVERLRTQMALARLSLDQLLVRAPIDGVLSSLSIEIGQRLAAGERLGVIDGNKKYELSSLISEFHISRIFRGMSGESNLGPENSKVPVLVDRVYPNVKNGQFEVRFRFLDHNSVPSRRRGQSIPIRIHFDSGEATLVAPRNTILENEGIFSTFVLEKNPAVANRRRIKVGRRNASEMEIISGLVEGEILIAPVKIKIPSNIQRIEIK